MYILLLYSSYGCINIFCIYVNWIIVRFYLKHDKTIGTCKVKTIICKHYMNKVLYEFCTQGVNIIWFLLSWLCYYWLSLLWIIPPTCAITACNIRSIAKCINDFNKKRANNKINKWEKWTVLKQLKTYKCHAFYCASHNCKYLDQSSHFSVD